MIVKNGRHSSVLLRIRVGLRAHREVLFGARFLDGSEQGNAADDENPEREYPDTRSGFGQKSRQENQPPAQNDEEQKRRDEINNETERFSDLKRKEDSVSARGDEEGQRQLQPGDRFSENRTPGRLTVTLMIA